MYKLKSWYKIWKKIKAIVFYKLSIAKKYTAFNTECRLIFKCNSVISQSNSKMFSFENELTTSIKSFLDLMTWNNLNVLCLAQSKIEKKTYRSSFVFVRFTLVLGFFQNRLPNSLIIMYNLMGLVKIWSLIGP